MKITTLALFMMLGSALRAQDAAQSNVDLSAEKNETPAPAKSPPPDVPELSQLDQAFKQTSLGKSADEYRVRVELRRLQNQVANEPAIAAAKAAASSARTDLEKRERLRDYYNVYYGRMRALASSEETKRTLDSAKAEHLKVLDQPRVRPTGNEPIPQVAPEKKKHKKSKFGVGG